MKKCEVSRSAVVTEPTTSNFRGAPFHPFFCENMQTWAGVVSYEQNVLKPPPHPIAV